VFVKLLMFQQPLLPCSELFLNKATAAVKTPSTKNIKKKIIIWWINQSIKTHLYSAICREKNTQRLIYTSNVSYIIKAPAQL